MQCTATAKSTGERCRRRAVTGYNVCQVHGAGSPKKGRPGGRPPIHGRYSTRMPKDLVQVFEEMKKDPDLLALKDDLALIQLRLEELTSQLGDNDHEISHKLVSKLDTAISLGDWGTVIEVKEAMEEHSDIVWKHIQDTLDSRNRLLDREFKRLKLIGEFISIPQFLALLNRIKSVIYKYVMPDDRAKVAYEIRAMLGLTTEEMGDGEEVKLLVK